MLAIGALTGLPGSACVIPPDLEPAGVDAGAGSKPYIVSAADPYAFPGPITVPREDSQTLSLTAEDPDVGDTLNVRLYVDYNRAPPMPEPIDLPRPALVECSLPPTGTVQRTIPCSTTTLCNQIFDGDDHFLEAMIADRQFLPGNHPDAVDQPEFRAIELGGGSTLSSWVMKCL